MARNVGFMDWLSDNQLLNNFHAHLDFGEPSEAREMLHVDFERTLRSFRQRVEFEKLLLDAHSPVDREDVGFLISSVQFDHEHGRNAIDLAIGLLQAPLFDPLLPAAVNFAGLGQLAALSVARALDTLGVLFDSEGRLRQLLVQESEQQQLKQTVECVREQYQDLQLAPGLRLNGSVTLQQNLADIAGLRAAHRAFRAQLAASGADPQLPTLLYDQLTREQLFFVAAARAHCEQPPAHSVLEQRELVAEAAPDRWRVFGAFRSLPAFGAAFNCPVGSVYAPPAQERCAVWTAPPEPTLGAPSIPTQRPDLRLGPLVPAKDTASLELVARLNNSVDLAYSPCQNFRSYACASKSSWSGLEDSERLVNAKVRDVLWGLASTPRTQSDTYARELFDACMRRPRASSADLRSILDAVDEAMGVRLNVSDPHQTIPPLNMSNLMRVSLSLATDFGLDLFFHVGVEPNLKRAFGEPAYLLHFRPPVLSGKPMLYSDYSYDFVTQLNELYGPLKPPAEFELAEDGLTVESMLNDFIGISDRTVPLPDSYEKVHVESLAEQDKFGGMLKEFLDLLVVAEPKLKPYLADERAQVVLVGRRFFADLHVLLDRWLQDSHLRRELLYYVYNRVLWKTQQFQSTETGPRFPVPDLLRPHLNEPVWRPARPTDPATLQPDLCAEQLAELLPLLQEHLAFRKTFPDPATASKVQKAAAEVVGFVQRAFAERFDGLSWMPQATKEKLALKLRSVAKHIGTAPLTADESAMEAAYAPLTSLPHDSFNYLQFWRQVNGFKLSDSLRLLFDEPQADLRPWLIGPHARHRAPSGLAVPERNAIFLGSARLAPPLYQPDQPVGWQFATLGVHVARLFSQLFDENGLQFNAFGQLDVQLDRNSARQFEQMLYSLGQQYKMLGNKATTEQLAENVGVQVALDALRAHVRLTGDSDRLPDPLLGQLNSEQLFFLTLSQEFCADRPPAYSPGDEPVDYTLPLRRVLGNDERFRKSFQCKDGDVYAPLRRVLIWDSEPDATFGRQDFSKPPPFVNMPTESPSTSSARERCSQLLEATMNPAANPCADFREFACGNVGKESLWDEQTVVSDVALLLALNQEAADTDDAPTAKTRLFMRQCRADLERAEELAKDGRLAIERVAEMERFMDIKFPLADPNAPEVEQFPSAQKLGAWMGHAMARLNTPILLAPSVYANPRNPDKGYAVYLDANGLDESSSDEIEVTLLRYMSVVYPNLTTEVRERIRVEANAFDRLETALMVDAHPPQDPHNMSQVYPSAKLSDLLEVYPPSVDLRQFLAALVQDVPDAVPRVTSPNTDLVLPDAKRLFDALAALQRVRETANITPTNMVNYFFWRVLAFVPQFLPPAPADLSTGTDGDEGNDGKRLERLAKLARQLSDVPSIIRQPERRVRRVPEWQQLDLELVRAQGLDPVAAYCAQMASQLIEPAASSMFVRFLYPDEARRDEQRLAVVRMVDSVSLGYRTMLDQLTWMGAAAKQEAYHKIDGLVRKVAFDELHVNSTLLTAFYADLHLNATDNLLAHVAELMRFNQLSGLRLLARPVFDRYRVQRPFETNAWYAPAENAFTLPASVLRAPMYDADFPAAYNFGLISSIIGHEIGHGFDNSGVQYDADGRLRDWMDAESRAGFRRMAQCVAEEYSQFCAPGPQRRCVNGQRTLGENLADNGGIRAAFRAYRAHLGMRGPEAPLPGRVLGRLTQDQLFFLAFARPWCSLHDWDSLGDVHAPPAVRILGTLRNFPEFRHAFHCPLNATYAPQQHCSVWVSEVEGCELSADLVATVGHRISALTNPTPLPPKPIDPPASGA